MRYARRRRLVERRRRQRRRDRAFAATLGRSDTGAALILPIASVAAAGGASALGATATALLAAGAGVVGSYIDNAFLLPTIFPPPDVEGQRIGEFRIQYAEEGSPLNMAFGEEIRVNGSVVWTSDLIEVQDTIGGGGKGGFGGGGSSQTVYTYFADVAVVFSATRGNAIDSVIEINANGKPLYRDEPEASFSGSATAQTPFIAFGGGTHWIIETSSLELGDFVAGGQCTVSGFSNGGNNGTFDVIASSADPAGPTSKLTLFNASGVAEGPTSITITQDVSQLSDALAESVEILDGSLTQNPSPTIEAIEGAGEVPGMRGYSGFVIKRLALAEFGNTIPTMNVIFRPASGNATVGAIISQVIDRTSAPTAFQSGLDISDADVDVRGYTFQGVVDAHQAIQPLLVAGDLLSQGNGTSLRIFRRKNATIIDVDPEDLAAHTRTQDRPDNPLAVAANSEVQRPDSIVVKYVDHEARFQSGAQRERSRVRGTTDSETVVNLSGVVLEGAGVEAREIARRLMFAGYVNGRRISLVLPIKYVHAQENDILRIPVPEIAAGVVLEVLIDKIDRGANYQLAIEGNLELRSVLEQTGVAESPLGTDVEFDPETDPVTGVVLDNEFTAITIGAPGGGNIPNTSVPNGGGVGAGCFRFSRPNVGPGEGGGFGGAVLHGKPTDEDEFRRLGLLDSEAYGGMAITTLGGGVDESFRDLSNTVDIELFHGTVSSTDLQGLLSGLGTVAIGDEIISFQTATLVSQNTWRLSDLIRGRLGTEGAIDGHSSNEGVLVLTGPGLERIDIPHGWYGRDIEFRLVPPSKQPADVVGFTKTIEKVGLRPLGPVAVVANRNGDNGDLDLRWNRRARAFGDLFGQGAAPLLANGERYEVDILDNSTEALLGTVIVNDTNTASITQSVLTSFGVSAATAFKVRVYQINTAYGGDGRGGSSALVSVGAT